MKKLNVVDTLLMAIMAIALVAFLSGCPQPGPAPEKPEFDFDAGIKDLGNDTWALRAFVTNDDAQVVTFQLFERDDDGHYFPISSAYEQRFGIVQNVTLVETDVQYLDFPIYSWNAGYYYWNPAYEYFSPVPYWFVQSHNINLTNVDVTVTRMNIVRGDGSYLFSSFEVGPGNYMIRITGLTDELEQFQTVEHIFPELEAGDIVDPPDPDDLKLFITDVPAYGDTEGVLGGMISGITAGNHDSYKVVVYLYVDGLYYVKPNYGDQAYTPINADGSWSCWVVTGGVDHLATQYVVYLVPNGTPVPMCGQDPAFCTSQPYIPGAVDVEQVSRQPIIYGGDGTIEFTSVPLFADQYGIVHGIVTDVNPANWRVAVYILVEGVWYLKPDCGALTPISADGRWQCDITVMPNDDQATDVAAYLVPPDAQLPCEIFPPATKSLSLSAEAPVIPQAVSSVAVNRLPLLAYTYVPVYGSSDGTIRGLVTSIHLDWYKVLIYIKVGTRWWVKPSIEAPLTDIGSDGQWETWFIQGGEDQNATEIWAYLVPYWLNPPSSPDGLLEQPTVQDLEAVAYVWVNRNPGIDNCPPVITVLGTNPLTREVLSGPYNDAGATAFDDVDGDLSGDISTTSTVDMTHIGTYTVTYEVEDSSGNSASAVRTVHVVDTVKPVITLLGANPQYVEVNSGPYVDPGATAMDNYDGDLSAMITKVSTVNMAQVGTYTVTYSVADSSGNTNTKVRTVHVCEPEDDTPPVITILGNNPLYFAVNSGPYVDPGATAMDDVDGNVTGDIVTTSTVDATHIGSYTVTYTVEDSAGNSASAVRTVYVRDTIGPVITILGVNPLTREVLSGPYNDAGANATDNYDGDLSGQIITTSTVDMTHIGTYTVTYEVEDSSGNSASAVRTVHVVDTTDPVITPPVPSIALYQLDWFEVDLANHGYDAYDPSPVWSASGYNSSLISVTIVGNLMRVTALDLSGTTTINLTLTDSSGNSASQTVNVTVNPIGAPTIEFTYVPEYDNLSDYMLQGEVRYASETQYTVIVYIKVPESGWWIKPDFAPGCYIPITRQTDGHKTWECLVVTGGNDHLATEFVAYLVPVGTTVPQANGYQQMPTISAAVASAWVPRPAPIK